MAGEYNKNRQHLKRVNGAMLSDSVGQQVCLIGQFIQMEPSGMMFKLKASDNQIVTVQTQEPVQDLLEGIIEVEGVVIDADKVQCRQYIVYPKDVSESFDMIMYSTTIALMQNTPYYTTMN